GGRSVSPAGSGRASGGWTPRAAHRFRSCEWRSRSIRRCSARPRVWGDDHRGRNESVRVLLYALGLMLLTPALAYGSWLRLTPDYDGGRRPMGPMVLSVMAVVVL